MILRLDTPEKFLALWEALAQYLDNNDPEDDLNPKEAAKRCAAALELQAQMDAEAAKATGEP